MDLTNAAIISALIGVIGGLVVWVLSWLWELYKESKVKRRIRAMLRIEIEGSLRDLRLIHSAAEGQGTLPNTPLEGLQRRDALTRSSLPNWSQATWIQLRPSIPLALSEMEIKRVYCFYSRLDELSTLHGGLATGDVAKRNQAFAQAVNKVLKEGNPIV